jgi:hypothetical protein
MLIERYFESLQTRLNEIKNHPEQTSRRNAIAGTVWCATYLIADIYHMS